MSTPYERTAGQMRHPVWVQREVDTDDGSGGQDAVWSNYCLIYCDIKDDSDTETSGDRFPGRVRTQSMKTFVTWQRRDISTQNRLKWDGVLWNIRDITDIEARGKYLSITAEAGVEQ